MENRSSMGDLSNPGPGFQQGEGTSNQAFLIEFGDSNILDIYHPYFDYLSNVLFDFELWYSLPDILPIEHLHDEPEIFPELNINSDDPVHASDFALDQTPCLLPG